MQRKRLERGNLATALTAPPPWGAGGGAGGSGGEGVKNLETVLAPHCTAPPLLQEEPIPDSRDLGSWNVERSSRNN